MFGAVVVVCGVGQWALDGIEFTDEVLRFFEDSFRGFKEATRTLPPARLIDGMTGNVAVLDGLRRRTTGANQHRCSTLQASYAELLSWLSEEAGDLRGAMTASSVRTATITRAKLARAYANAGLPEEACRVAWDTLDAIEQVGSLSARNELRRAVPVLNRWHGRSDVQDVLHRLAA